MHVQYWSWLLLWVLGNAQSIRRSIHCSSDGPLALPRFNVHCTRASPCHDVDIFCPAASNTEMLSVDCHGPHACSNVNIYSSVSSVVRCRGRSSACDNVNYYCGDMRSVLAESSAGSLFSNSNADSAEAISCKFQHLTAYGTVNSFFGCYGNVGECTSTAITDYAFTDNHMYCGTENTPCVMNCQTGASCMNDQLECTTENSHLCQCNGYCASVRIGPQILSTTEDQQIPTTSFTETTSLTELPAEAKQQSTTSIQATSTSTSVLTTSTSVTTKQGETVTTAKPSTTQILNEETTEKASTTSTQIVDEESTEKPSTFTTQILGEESTTKGSIASTTDGETATTASSFSSTQIHNKETTTESPIASTSQTLDEESTTKSSFGSTSQPLTTINIMTTKISSVTDTTGQPGVANLETSTGHRLKDWQLALLIVLPTIAVAIGCFIVVYAVQRWKKDEPEIYAPLKNIQITVPTTNNTETTMAGEENQHTKCASAQSIDLVFDSPETDGLNTTTIATEGDGH